MYLSSISSQLLLFDTTIWNLKKSYGCYEGILRDISWSDDSKYLLQVNAKGSVEILSPVDHEIRSLQHIPLKDTWTASFHRDGHRNIAIGTKSGNVLIWDTKNKTITKSFPTPAQQSSVDFLSFNAKNTSLAATMHNGDTIIYGLVSNIPVLTIKLPSSKSISAMKYHHESRSLLGLATEEGHVVLRDVTTNKDKAFFENVHASPVSDFTYSLINKDVMLSCGYDKMMLVYDVRLQNVVSSIKTTNTLSSLSINLENQVALGTKSGTILVYDLRDISAPVTVLQGHEEEVRKVAFQPSRKKGHSTEISLKEESKIQSPHQSPQKIKSPTQHSTSDLFYVCDTPPSNKLDDSGRSKENRADSFLVMMGLDKSNLQEEDSNKSTGFDKRSDRQEHFSGQEKNMNQMSTPLNNRPAELGFPSPICAVNGVNGVPDDGNNLHPNMPHVRPSNNHTTNSIDAKSFEDLKDFIKINLFDIADDNRNYFLHIMMELTKQKLFLERQVTAMGDEIKTLVRNQNSLMESNRKLALEIEQIKAQNINVVKN